MRKLLILEAGLRQIDSIYQYSRQHQRLKHRQGTSTTAGWDQLSGNSLMSRKVAESKTCNAAKLQCLLPDGGVFRAVTDLQDRFASAAGITEL